MNLYPAIDILGGNAVRLVKGDFEAKKVYDESPLSAARAFAEEGARYLHVVDLDGARRGVPVNIGGLRAIVEDLGLPVQFGGGLRSTAAVAEAFAANAARVILGTAVFTNPELLLWALKVYGPDRIVVSIDARGGYVATHGWLEVTKTPTSKAIKVLGRHGVERFVYTNIDHDGMLDGIDGGDAAMAARAAGDGSVILSGGIGELAHLQAIGRLRSEQQLDGLDGVIVGKALYERRFTVAEALAVLDD